MWSIAEISQNGGWIEAWCLIEMLVNLSRQFWNNKWRVFAWTQNLVEGGSVSAGNSNNKVWSLYVVSTTYNIWTVQNVAEGKIEIKDNELSEAIAWLKLRPFGCA